MEITQQTRVEIRLVRISNQAETQAVEFTFWPGKKTQREQRTQTSILEGMLTNEGISSSKNEETELSINKAKNISINNKYA